MKKKLLTVLLVFMMITTTVLADTVSYVVQPGDSMWKIAVKYQVGVSEIIKANPQVSNPSLIYPGQKLSIPTVNPAITTQEDAVIKLVNVERTKRGLQPLVKNWQLCRIARIKSQDMINNNYFDHTSPVYGSPFNMMENFGIRFSAAGENIAYGQQSAQEVMNDWMNSPGHRANILSPAYTQIGVGLAVNSKGIPYWTQEFIKPM